MAKRGEEGQNVCKQTNLSELIKAGLYRQFRPVVPVLKNPSKWWKYAYDAVINDKIKPYTWPHILAHRQQMRAYCDTYKKVLIDPTNTEIKVDLQRLEDNLDIYSAIIARERTKMQMYDERLEGKIRIVLKEQSNAHRIPQSRAHVYSASSKMYKLCVDKGENTFWNRLSRHEKNTLYRMMGLAEINDEFSTATDNDKDVKQHTEYKFNFNVINFTFKLISARSEIAVGTMSRIVANVETRPIAKAYKLSARIESVVIEATTVELCLKPLITSVKIGQGERDMDDILNFDFEKKITNHEVNYVLSIKSESPEVVYNEFSVSLLASYLHTPALIVEKAAISLLKKIKKNIGEWVSDSLRRKIILHLCLDIKLPRLVIPESGFFQHNKNVIFFDLGRLKLWNEVQKSSSNLEDATQIELEERSYDRFHLSLTDLQILMFNYDQNWRNLIYIRPSRHRILSKVNLHLVFSNSIRPESTQFPRYKLNSTVQKLKVNISDGRAISIISFVQNLPRPKSLTVFDDSYTSLFLHYNADYAGLLEDIRHAFAYAVIKRSLEKNCDLAEEMKISFLNGGSRQQPQQLLPSQISEEDSEIWAKLLDLPGFDDNISVHNSIICPFRINIVQIVLELQRTVSNIDKSYITVEALNFSSEIAFMEYGLAAQLTLGVFNIVDKLHTITSVNSPSLSTQLLRTEENFDFLTILYREVRSDCPDFQSYFHNVERSLVVQLNPLQIVGHREALIDLHRYTRYFLDRYKRPSKYTFRLDWSTGLKSSLKQRIQRLRDKWLQSKNTPPIPPGAVKFSYSARIASVKFNLCDTDVDFILIRIDGFEFDFILKANERFVFKLYLATISIDDISNTTLYPKILSTEEEKLMEVKYDRRTTNFRKFGDAVATHLQQAVKSDGNLKLYLGRTKLVVTFKHVQDMRRFFGPFFSTANLSRCVNYIEEQIQKFFTYLRFCEDKICISILCQLPSFLLPRQASSPDLIIFSAGDLTAENFYKELTIEETDRAICSTIDNVLIKLDNVIVSTAIGNLSGSIVLQDTIIERICCKIDMKRTLINKETPKGDGPFATFRIDFNVNKITAAMQQKDLHTFNVIWSENLKKIIAYCQFEDHKCQTSLFREQANVRKLQEFFNRTENNGKYSILTGTFDGLEVGLFSDNDEFLSSPSPMREEVRSLCELKVGEVTFYKVTFENGRNESQISVQSLLLEDTRSTNDVFAKEVVRSHAATTRRSDENSKSAITPFLSINWSKSLSNESKFRASIEPIRLNFIVSFFTDLSEFILGPFAYYETTLNFAPADTDHDEDSQKRKQIHEAGDIDHSQESDRDHAAPVYSDDRRGETWSIECKDPEIMFFSPTKDACKGHTLLLRCALSFEFQRRCSDTRFTTIISDLHILSRVESEFVRTHSDLILQPCHLHVFYILSTADSEKKIFASCDKIDAHLSSSTVQAAVNIIREIKQKFLAETVTNRTVRKNCENSEQTCHDVWSPKKALPHYLPNQFERCPKTSRTQYETECAAISFSHINLAFEIEDVIQKKPVIFFTIFAGIDLKNWSNSVEMKGDLRVQCSYYNFEINQWEPVIEPTIGEGNVYRPWSISLKVFKAKSHLVNTIVKSEVTKKKKELTKCNEKLETIEDEEQPQAAEKRNLSTSTEEIDWDFSDTESETENDDTVIENLKSKFGLLLTGSSSDEKSTSDSETNLSEHVSSLNDSDGPSTTDDDLNMAHFQMAERIIFDSRRENLNNSVLSSQRDDKAAAMTTYVIIETRDRFEMVVTPCTVSVTKQILDSFTLKFNNVIADTQFLSLKNDLVPHSTVQLLSKMPSEMNRIVMSARYSYEESIPSSRNSTMGTPNHSESPTECSFGKDDDIEESVAQTCATVEGTATSCCGIKSDIPVGPIHNNTRVQIQQFRLKSVNDIFYHISNRRLHITVEGFDDSTIFCPARTCYKYHALHPIKNNVRYYIVICVKNDLWGQSIVVRSPLQIKNETAYAVSLHYKKCSLTDCGFEHIGEITNPFEDSYKFAIVEPDEIYNVPISITYHCPIYISPIYENYHLSETGIWWKELVGEKASSKNIICKAKDGKSAVFVTRAITSQGARFSSSPLPDMPNFVVRLFPSVVIRNLLPYPTQVKIPLADINVKIEAGGKSTVYSLDTTTKSTISIEIPSYFGSTWIGNFNFHDKMEEKLISMKTDHDTGDASKMRLVLSTRLDLDKSESRTIVIFAPYWIVNKTDLPLQIKGSQSDTVYDISVEEPQFLSFRKGKKNIIRLRVYHSTWSSAISIEAVGCNQLTTCWDRERNLDYRIVVEITPSKLSAITKVITFLPYFLLLNELNLSIRYMEENEQADFWVDLPQNQTIPFWPKTNSMKMYVKYNDSIQISQHFYINRTGCSVLRMEKGNAIVVDVDGGQQLPFLIVFRHYREGDAPVRIENFCQNLFLKVSQESVGQATLVSPGQSLLYTWDDPTAEKNLLWNIYNRKGEGFHANIETDGYGHECIRLKLTKSKRSGKNTFSKEYKLSSFKKVARTYYGFESSDSEENFAENNNKCRATKANKGKLTLFWISFLEENQRVLLFTQDKRIADQFQLKTDFERSDIELFISIKGAGLSLVKNRNNVFQEFAYVSINDSTSVWEVNVAHKWKVLPLELATWIEDQWKQGNERAQLKDYVTANLKEMRLVKPFFGELRRNYTPAIWVHCKQSPKYRYFRWQIHTFQVDNQVEKCEFATVLHRKVPKISLGNASREGGLKPCLEMSALQKHREDYHAELIRFKYIIVSVAEFCVQLEAQFMEDVYELIRPCLRIQSSSLRIQADICKIYRPLILKSAADRIDARKILIEYLFVSPLRIQFSSSRFDATKLNFETGDRAYLPNFTHAVLNCIRADDNNPKRLTLKSPGLKRTAIKSGLRETLVHVCHYYSQHLLRTVYAYISGIHAVWVDSDLDADSYEEQEDNFNDSPSNVRLPPIEKGNCRGDGGEFATRCLCLGHARCSSPANAVDSFSSLREKREHFEATLHQKIYENEKQSELTMPEMGNIYYNFVEPDSVIKGDKCFSIGVLHGLSGMRLKRLNSVSATRENGTELFFKTAGKHLLKLLNKYDDTVSDICDTVIDGVWRAIESGANVTVRKRPPKHIHYLSGMKPYSAHHAIGMNILKTVDEEMYADTDDYCNHVALTPDGKSCLLLSRQRIMLIKKTNIWDKWQIEWQIHVNDLVDGPQILHHKLVFKTARNPNQNRIIQQQPDHEEQSIKLEPHDTNALHWIRKIIRIIVITNMENQFHNSKKPCTDTER